MQGTFGIEWTIEEVPDLLQRKGLALVTGSDCIALDGFKPFRKIHRDQTFFFRQIEDVTQNGEVLLLGHWREQRLALFCGCLDRLLDWKVAVEFGPVGRQPREDAPHTQAGIIIDGLNRRSVAYDFTDEGQAGALPVEPFRGQTVDSDFLFGQAHAKSHVGWPSRIEQLVEEGAAVVVRKPSEPSAAEFQKCTAHKLGQGFARHIGIVESPAGWLKQFLPGMINPLLGLRIVRCAKSLSFELGIGCHLGPFAGGYRSAASMSFPRPLILPLDVVAHELHQVAFRNRG
jgi:hypothetical protein